MLQVDPSMVVHAYIRLPVFSLPCLYQILCFGVVHAPHRFPSPSYNVQAPVFFTYCFSLSYLYHQIFCFGVIPAPRCFSSFLYNVRTPVFFMRCILFFLSCINQALFIYAMHPASLFIYQPCFIHSYTAFCLSLHLSAGKQLYAQEIRADEYKTPCWPIQPLFSLVHIA